jgi:hypothetical protein
VIDGRWRRRRRLLAPRRRGGRRRVCAASAAAARGKRHGALASGGRHLLALLVEQPGVVGALHASLLAGRRRAVKEETELGVALVARARQLLKVGAVSALTRERQKLERERESVCVCCAPCVCHVRDWWVGEIDASGERPEAEQLVSLSAAARRADGGAGRLGGR